MTVNRSMVCLLQRSVIDCENQKFRHMIMYLPLPVLKSERPQRLLAGSKEAFLQGIMSFALLVPAIGLRVWKHTA